MQAIRIALVGTVLAAMPVKADDASVEVIKKAIAAHGGADNLRKAQSVRGKASVTADRDGTPITAEVEYVSRLPDYERVTVTRATGDPNKVVRVVAKDQFYLKDGTQFVELSSDMQAEKKSDLMRQYVCTLVPLLTDKAYTLSLVGEQSVGAGKATGIHVQKQKELDVILYFDNASGLLVKAEFQGFAPDQKRVKKELVYSNYKAIDGVMRPMTLELYFDGKLLMKSTVREEQLGQVIKDSEFDKP